MFIEYIKKSTEDIPGETILNQLMGAVRATEDPFTRAPYTGSDKEINKYVGKLPKERDLRLQRNVLTGVGGVYGGLLGAMGSLLLQKGNLTKGKTIAGALIGGGLGGVGARTLHKKVHKGYSELSKEQKRELVKKYIAKQIAEKDTLKSRLQEDGEKMYGLHSSASIAAAIGQTGAGLTLVPTVGALPTMSDETLHELISNSGINGKVHIAKPTTEKIPMLSENAYFSDAAPKDHIGSITATSKCMWKPGIIAHELGHGNIHTNPGLVKFLQDNLYAPTMRANQFGLGVLPSIGTYYATKNDTDPVTGAAKGLGIGTAANIGILAPEFEASRRGIANILKTKLPVRQKITNSASLLPAFLTYLLSTAGVNAGVGAIHARYNKKCKDKEEREKRRLEKKAR